MKGSTTTTDTPAAAAPGAAARRWAATAWIATVALAVPALVLIALGATEQTPADTFGLTGLGGVSFLVAGLAFATTGALIASRVRHNPVGPIFCLIGLMLVAGNLPYQWADYALYVSPGSLPGGEVAAVLQNLGLTPCFGLLACALLLFPSGSLPSRRWRPAFAVAVAGSVCIWVGYALRPGPLDAPFEHVANPLGTASFGLMDALTGVGWLLMVVGLALAALSLVARSRRAAGAEREQLKWITFAASLAGVVFVLNGASFALAIEGIDQLRLVIVGLAFAAFPVTGGIAILRYRIYDIDVVINRTLVYGALTATLAIVYPVSVLVLQALLGGLTQGSGLAVAGSTLAVAALFQPARTRIQTLVDRRFYRRKYDAQRTLEAFSATVRDEVDLVALDGRLSGVVRETLQPAHVSLWLRERETS